MSLKPTPLNAKWAAQSYMSQMSPCAVQGTPVEGFAAVHGNVAIDPCVTCPDCSGEGSEDNVFLGFLQHKHQLHLPRHGGLGGTWNVHVCGLPVPPRATQWLQSFSSEAEVCF